MNKLLLGLLIASTNAFAVSDYEVAEKKLAMCKSMGDMAVMGHKSRKDGYTRATIASSEVTAKFGVEIQEAMLNGWDAGTKSEDRVRQIGFAKCMDKYSKQ
jgi:hypothetical protein